MRTITLIVLHCSATVEGKDFTVTDIDRWHRQRGWKNGIGYHYVVYRDGSVHEGRPLWMVGAHCVNHNKYSIGICYIGGLDKDGHTPKDTRTGAQKQALRDLVRTLRRQFPQTLIVGHHDLDKKKACPCFRVNEYYEL